MRKNELLGVCQRRSMAATAGKPSLWDPQADAGREREEDVNQRHRSAKIMCQACPLLDACEAALSAHEKAGVLIAGVVAGRYSDVARKDNEHQLVSCRLCGEDMLPQAMTRKTIKQRKHTGEGLCDWCYPQVSRATRRRMTAA